MENEKPELTDAEQRLRLIAAVTFALQAAQHFDRRIAPAVTKVLPFVPACPACEHRITEADTKFVEECPQLEELLQAAERKTAVRMRPVLRAVYGHRTTCTAWPEYERRCAQARRARFN